MEWGMGYPRTSLGFFFFPYYFYQSGPENWRPNAVHNERFLCRLTQLSAHNGDRLSLIDSCTLSPVPLSDNSTMEAKTEESPTDTPNRGRGVLCGTLRSRIKLFMAHLDANVWCI